MVTGASALPSAVISPLVSRAEAVAAGVGTAVPSTG